MSARPLSSSSRPPTRRLFAVVLLAGLPGVAAFAGLAIPAALGDQVLPVPLWWVMAGVGLQSGLLLAAAAAAGAVLAPRVGLHAPMCEALAARGRPWSVLRPQIRPGLIGGLACAVALLGLDLVGPVGLRAAQTAVPLPGVVRVLYGGLTEEVLMRWGVMTVLVWLGWRLLQRGRGRPAPALVAAGIGASALVFGLAHLPALQGVLGPLPLALALPVVGAHGLVGVVTGWLFHRHGLEAAMVAHASARLLGWAVGP